MFAQAVLSWDLVPVQGENRHVFGRFTGQLMGHPSDATRDQSEQL